MALCEHQAYWIPDEGSAAPRVYLRAMLSGLQETRDYLKSLPMDEDPRIFGSGTSIRS